MHRIGLATLALLGGIMATYFTSASAAPTDPPARLLRHIVLYQFNADATDEQIQGLIDAFTALPAKIDQIVSLEHGRNVSTEGKSEDLTYGFVVTFRSQEDLETYLKHAAHQEYVKVARDTRKRAVVFDYWTSAE